MAAVSSSGQLCVWSRLPPKVSSPGMSGVLAAESAPVASTTNRAVTISPVSVATVQRAGSSEKMADATRVSNVTLRFKSSLSATNSM